MGQTCDGGDGQHGGGNGVLRIGRRGADGIEAGSEPGRRQQAHSNQHQQRHKQHGLPTPIAPHPVILRLVAGRQPDRTAGDGQTDCQRYAIPRQQDQRGARKPERRHAHRSDSRQGHRGRLVDRDREAGEEHDQKKERGQRIEGKVHRQPRWPDRNAKRGRRRTHQKRRQAQQHAQPARDAHQEGATGRRQHAGAGAHQKQGNRVNGQEQEDRIAHRQHDITAGRSRDPASEARAAKAHVDGSPASACYTRHHPGQAAREMIAREVVAVPPDTAVAGDGPVLVGVEAAWRCVRAAGAI